jgi:hypothetical protein
MRLRLSYLRLQVVSRIPESKAVILMMTKLDVLKEKIARKPLTAAFPEYTGI